MKEVPKKWHTIHYTRNLWRGTAIESRIEQFTVLARSVLPTQGASVDTMTLTIDGATLCFPNCEFASIVEQCAAYAGRS